LATNFFALVRASAGDPFQPSTDAVYDFVRRYWKKSAEELAASSFDLEELFTLLQAQMSSAMARSDAASYRDLRNVYDDLTEWLVSYLAQFEGAPVNQSSMRYFGEILWRERPTVITFNYDCIIEYAIATASGINPGPYPTHGDITSDLAITHSHHNWNRALCYGITFDEVEPFRAGIAEPIRGGAFYSHPSNALYESPILKLHGSVNWLRYVPARVLPSFRIEEDPPTGSILQIRPRVMPFGNQRNGWLTERELVTPVLYKESWLQNQRFDELWKHALAALSGCQRLVVIGYSFPPTDFATKRLFLEAFADRFALDELVVVNPNTRLIDVVKELTHHAGAVLHWSTLDEYILAHGGGAGAPGQVPAI
jgi:hypothetical protein